MKYEIRFRDCGKKQYIILDTYEDMWVYLNELYQFSSVTNIELYIGSDLVDFYDYLG